MKTSSLLWALVIAVVVLAVGSYWMQSTQPPTPAIGPNTQLGINGSPNQGNLGQPASGTPQQPGQTSPAGDGTGPAVNLTLGVDSKDSTGKYLIAFTGQALYTFDHDTTDKSNCSGNCATQWPPYTMPINTPMNLQAGITGKVSMITRPDGSLQVSYNGHPLYFYAGDKNGGDTTGDGVGGIWHLARP
ncbi:MAG TPA: hypothetical protein VMU25_00040 [Candidatus Paceibacterota bacterium]|nr:hypothetical protein [Candidatus Paceibacterota bacterium]